MISGLALRDRLAVSFALALVLAYIGIAVCAVFVVNRELSASIDARVSTVAQALVAIAGDSADDVDREDRQQFASITADASGALVLNSDGAIVLGTSQDIPAWIPVAMRGAIVGRPLTAHPAGRELRAIVERRRKHGTQNRIIVWQSMQIVRDVEASFIVVLSGFAVAVLIGGYAIGAQIARRGLLPLTRITAIVADIAANDLDARVGPQPHADEVGQLSATFDRMLDRLAAVFERQRRFTADASHDLRAPLATLRADVDLALRRERTVDEYRLALRAIADDADQLDRLIDALLAAARSEAGELELTPIDLSTATWAAVEAIAAFAHAKHVTLDTQIPASCEITGDRDLLGRAILATLHNAVKYTPEESVISIRVTPNAQHVELRVRDEGPGFSDSALSHAFERFWRDDSARGRTGSGLGLAIASEIVRRCGGAIAIENHPNGGAEVIMSFAVCAQRPTPVPHTV